MADSRKLRNIRLPEGLKAIPSELLQLSKGLYNLTVPKSVETIDATFLAGCSKLQYITVDASMPEKALDALLDAVIISGSKPILYTELSALESAAKNKIERFLTLKEIELLTTDLSLNPGKSFELRMTGHAKCDSWTSSNPEVASVNYYGRIVAKKPGTTTITCTLYGKEYRCTVTVR